QIACLGLASIGRRRASVKKARTIWSEHAESAHEADADGPTSSAGWLDPGGWGPDDWTYAQTETQAALLGWLWSLARPARNRHRPDPWFRLKAPLVHWQPVLARCGLPAPEILATNLPAEARAFGDGHGAVYTPMLGETSYLLTGPADWSGLE